MATFRDGRCPVCGTTPMWAMRCNFCRALCETILKERAARDASRRAEQQQARQSYNPNNSRWTKPVHGTTAGGNPVTVSFGKADRDDQTGIADGHISDAQYYGTDSAGVKGHDHYGPNGDSYADRGRYTDE